MQFAKKCGIYVLAAAGLLACAVILKHCRTSKTVAEIAVDGEIVKTVDLAKVTSPYEFKVETEQGYNIILIAPNKISVTESDCPDKICVNQGKIGAGDLPIVCLPHKLTITMNDNSDKIDAVSGK